MKRFITYLYEYENGEKRKSVGFVRVNIRGDKVELEICIKNYVREELGAKIYLLACPNNVVGICLDKIRIGGAGEDTVIAFEKENIQNTGYSFSNIIGIGIRLENEKYLASAWNDEEVALVANGIWKEYEKEVSPEIEEIQEEVIISEMKLLPEEDKEIFVPAEAGAVYEKITLDQIRSFPSENWHLATNSFLTHGLLNYGYLLLKKENSQMEERVWLGVPGFFEKPEFVMALFFGFAKFEPVPKEVASLDFGVESRAFQIEKNQEPKTGIFGCWFVELVK